MQYQNSSPSSSKCVCVCECVCVLPNSFQVIVVAFYFEIENYRDILKHNTANQIN